MGIAGGVGRQPEAGSRVGAAALLLGSSALLSRFLGYGREALIAYRVGAGASTDAYYAAFQIPDLLNYLLAGGALSVAFLPLYAKELARGNEGAADHLVASVLGTLGAVSLFLTVLLWYFAQPLIALQFPSFDPETQALTVHLTRIVLPAQIFFVVGGIINATLLARNRFGAAAAAPLFYNGGIIAGGLFLTPRLENGIEGFAWGALAGGILGPFLAPLFDARRRVRLRLRFAPLDRVFLGYLLVAAPLMLGQTLLTVDEWYGRWFGALLGEGTVAHLSYARRLMLVPVAVVGQAIAAAALPTLSRLWAEGKREDLERLVLRTLQAGLGLAALAASACVAMSRELVGVVYQHGAFNAADAATVAAILSILALAAPAWIAQQIAVRAFYARGDTWRPMLLGTVIAASAIPLYLVLGRRFGVLGLAAAGVLGMVVNASATIVLARCLHGAPPLRALLVSLARAAVVAVAAGVGASLVTIDAAPVSTGGMLANLLVKGLVFAAIALAGIPTIGGEAMRDTLRRVFRRFR